MIPVHINGEAIELPTGASLKQALEHFLDEKQQSLSFAVALNSDFVAKQEYDAKILAANDSIDVLFPIYGG